MVDGERQVIRNINEIKKIKIGGSAAVIIRFRIRKVIVNGDPRSVRYAEGVTHSQWVFRTLWSADRWSADGVRCLCDTRTVWPTVSGSAERCDPQTGGQRTGSTVCAIRERCDPQSVGLPNVVIRRQVVRGRVRSRYDIRAVWPTVSGSAERCDLQTGGQRTGSKTYASKPNRYGAMTKKTLIFITLDLED